MNIKRVRYMRGGRVFIHEHDDVGNHRIGAEMGDSWSLWTGYTHIARAIIVSENGFDISIYATTEYWGDDLPRVFMVLPATEIRK